MNSFKLGEVLLLPFAYADLADRKRRPGVVLLDTGDKDILIAKITTQRYDSPFDFKLDYWNEAGLRAPSYVRVHKLLVLEKSLVLQRVGALAPSDLDQLRLTFHNLV